MFLAQQFKTFKGLVPLFFPHQYQKRLNASRSRRALTNSCLIGIFLCRELIPACGIALWLLMGNVLYTTEVMILPHEKSKHKLHSGNERWQGLTCSAHTRYWSLSRDNKSRRECPTFITVELIPLSSCLAAHCPQHLSMSKYKIHRLSLVNLHIFISSCKKYVINF